MRYKISKMVARYVESEFGTFVKYVLICVLTLSLGLGLSNYSDILGGLVIFSFIIWGLSHVQALVNASGNNGRKNTEAFFYSFTAASIIVVSGLIILAASRIFSSEYSLGFTADYIFTSMLLFIFIILSMPIVWAAVQRWIPKDKT